MNLPTRLTDSAGEVRKLTLADIRRFKPAADAVAPEKFKVICIQPHWSQKAPNKQTTIIRISP